jgi:hypothetical protein
MMRVVLLPLILLLGMAHAADPLTKDQVEGFLAVAEDMQAMDEKYPDVEIDFTEAEQDPMGFMQTMFSEDGELQLMDVLMNKIKEHPEVRRDLEGSVKENGFRSLDDFATTGDRVLLTSIRMEMSKSDLQGLKQSANLPKEQLAMVPANMRPMLERMSMFAKAVESVPEGDVALVRQYRDRFEALNR